MANYELKPKNGRARIRRSFIVDVETTKKFSRVARLSGVQSSELLRQVMEQTVQAWERAHGEIMFQTIDNDIDLSAAILAAAATPKLKQGNPHPTGHRPKKSTKQ